MSRNVVASARRALDAWHALDSKDGLGAALYVGQQLAGVIEVLVMLDERATVEDGTLRESLAMSMCQIYCGPYSWGAGEGSHSVEAHRLDADYLLAKFDISRKYPSPQGGG